MRSAGDGIESSHTRPERSGLEKRRPSHLLSASIATPVDWLASVVSLAEKITRALAVEAPDDSRPSAADRCRSAGTERIERTTSAWVRRLVLEGLLRDRGLSPALSGRLLPSTAALAPLPPGLVEENDPSTLPAGPPAGSFDRLGAVHELFSSLRWCAGRLVPGHEQRKRKGLFFTPPEVTRLMVERLCESIARNQAPLTPEGILSLRLVDPACGTGALLVATYRHLLAMTGAGGPAGTTREDQTSTRLRLGLLESCLYGVDTDAAAVELARCNLALAYLDAGGNPEEIPSLEGKIRTGDALLAASESDSVRWPELFPEVFDAGGFDGVICNPPYCFGENIDARTKNLLRRTFRCASARQWDTWAPFLELGLEHLTRCGASYAYIVPDALLARRLAAGVRAMLLEKGPPHEVWHLGPVFRSPAIRPDHTRGTRPSGDSSVRVCEVAAGVSALVLVGRHGERPRRLHLMPEALRDDRAAIRFSLIRSDPWQRFLLELDDPDGWERWLALLQRSTPLENFLVGPRLGRGEERAKRDLSDRMDGRHTIPVLGGGEAIRPYRIAPRRRFVEHLSASKRIHYRAGPKLLAAKTGERLVVARAPVNHELAFLQTIYALHLEAGDLDYLEGWLNTELLNWVIRVTITAYKRVMPQLTQDEIRTLPVPRLPAPTKENIARLVERIRRAGNREAGHLQAEIDRLFIRELGLAPLHPAKH